MAACGRPAPGGRAARRRQRTGRAARAQEGAEGEAAEVKSGAHKAQTPLKRGLDSIYNGTTS